MGKEFGIAMHSSSYSRTKTVIIENESKSYVDRDYYNKSTKILSWRNLKKCTTYHWNDRVRYTGIVKMMNIE